MSTFDQLAATLARVLRDPNHDTFSLTEIGDMIVAGLTEVGRLAPDRFQQDIQPVAGQLEYPLHGTAEAEIEVLKVEVWNIAASPIRYVGKLHSTASEYSNASSVGWRVWNGTLLLSNSQEAFLDPAVHLLRVWGYAPYTQVSGGTAMPVSNELEQAILTYCRLEALRRLIGDRALFTQFQSQSGNLSASPGSLLSDLSLAEENWRRTAKSIFVIREASR